MRCGFNIWTSGEKLTFSFSPFNASRINGCRGSLPKLIVRIHINFVCGIYCASLHCKASSFRLQCKGPSSRFFFFESAPRIQTNLKTMKHEPSAAARDEPKRLERVRMCSAVTHARHVLFFFMKRKTNNSIQDPSASCGLKENFSDIYFNLQLFILKVFKDEQIPVGARLTSCRADFHKFVRASSC